MPPRFLACTLALAAAFPGIVLAAEPARELLVLCSNLAKPVVAELIATFETNAGGKVRIEYANNPIVQERVATGAECDLVIVEPQMLAELGQAGRVQTQSIVALAQIGMGLIARADAPAAETGSVAAFERVLRAAQSIAYTADGHSGSVFLRTIERLGLHEALAPKLRPITGRFATEAVLDGSAQYAAFPVWKPAPGLRVAGKFPAEIQTYIGVAGAIGSRSTAVGPAAAFLRHLISDSASAAFVAQGFEVR